ncbi:MAG: thymidylate kinase [bacterium]|nr:thymidylate kinase [bacterium]
MTTTGKFFVIDGVDGSGKGTQTRLIIDRLKQDGHDVLEADFPQYGNKSAALVEEYLNGNLGTLEEVDAYQASIFYACDRFAASKAMKTHLEKGGIIISNRYVTANQIHQSSKIRDEDELDAFLGWLDNLEYNIFKIPRADKVIFLNMPFKIGQELVGKKDTRNYIEGNKIRDIHEASLDHLQDAYKRACSLVEKYDEWVEIKCVGSEDSIKPIELIHSEIYNLIQKELNLIT